MAAVDELARSEAAGPLLPAAAREGAAGVYAVAVKLLHRLERGEGQDGVAGVVQLVGGPAGGESLRCPRLHSRLLHTAGEVLGRAAGSELTTALQRDFGGL